MSEIRLTDAAIDAQIDAKLAEMGLALPQAAAPVAAYVPVVITGGLAHVSGQLPFIDGKLVTGRLGEDVSLEDGTAAARACGLMILAQLKAALGSLDRVERVVKLGAFISSTSSFTDQPKVANGASELMAALFGEAGKHARSAVGVPVLPLGAAVEVDAIIAVRPARLSGPTSPCARRPMKRILPPRSARCPPLNGMR